MQACAKCGNHNSTDSIFCAHCGNRLNNKCPGCGFDNLPQQQFCGNCGRQLQPDMELPGSARTIGQAAAPPPPAQAAPSAPRPETTQPPPMQPAEQTLPPSGLASRLPTGTATIPPPPDAAIQPPSPQAAPTTQTAPVLEQYAVLSVEVAHWEQLRTEAFDSDALTAERNVLLETLAEHLDEAGAQTRVVNTGTLFAAFRQAPSERLSVVQAVENCLEMLEESLVLADTAIRLKIGIGLEHTATRDGMASVMERSVGLPGTLTLDEASYQLLDSGYQAEQVGPVTISGRSFTFYRLLPAVSKKEEAAPLPERAATPTSLPEETLVAGAQPSATEEEEIPPAITEDQPPSAAEIENVAEEPPPLDVQETGTRSSAARAGTDASDWMKRARPLQARPEQPPAPPQYEKPELLMRKASRQANLNYEKAIGALTTELETFLAEGTAARGRVVTLCAADGLGKSSIVNMARGAADPSNERGVWMGAHNYRSFAGGGQKTQNLLPLAYWQELLQNLLSLVIEGQPAREVRMQIERFLGFVYEGDPAATEKTADMQALLEDFLSVHPPQPLQVEDRENQGRIERFFLNFLSHMAARRPLVIVLEDLQHADAASLELFARLLEKGLLDHPVCFVLTQTRDCFAAGRLANVLQKGRYKELVISELDDAEAARFLNDGPLGGQLDAFPTELTERLLQCAGGLPLVLEELLRWLHLKEVLAVEPTSGKFTMNMAYDPMEMPLSPELSAIVRQRLGYLADRTLYLLRLAAVLGEKFAISLLMALSQMKEDEFNQSLTALFNHGFLLPDAVNTGRFRHGLLWQAVYEGIDNELCVQMHQLVSEALENDFNRGYTVNPALIAHHAENGELPNRALNYWNLAGIHAAKVGAITAMNMALFQAMVLLRQSTDQPLHSQELALRMMENAGVFNLRFNPDLSVDALSWVLFYREAEGDTTSLIEPLSFLSMAFESKGDFVEALATTDRALALVDRQAYPAEASALLVGKLEQLYTLGRMGQALALIEQEIEPTALQLPGSGESDSFDDTYLQARFLKAQVLLAMADSHAMGMLEEVCTQAAERRLEDLALAAQMIRGQALLRGGQYETCNQEADGLLSAVEALGASEEGGASDQTGAGWFLAQWGLLAILYHSALVDWNSASQLVLTVLSKSEESRDYLTWMTAQVHAGHISANLGKTKEARQLMEQVTGIATDHHFATPALLGWRFLAELRLSEGQPEAAAELVTQALAVAEAPEIANRFETLQLRLLSARIAVAQNELKTAGKLLEALWPEAVQTRMQPMIATCAFEIGSLYKAMAQDARPDLSKKHLMRSVEFFLKAKGIWLELRHLPNVKRTDALMPRL